MKRRFFLVLILAISATLALAATNSLWEHVPVKDHARTNPLANNPKATAAGALVYADHCAQCHKVNAQGDGHKRPTLKSERMRTVSAGDIEWFLRQGNLRTGMPSWSSLPEAQRWQVVAYLKSIQ
jgi:mono/diheme cytochrome c family protein